MTVTETPLNATSVLVTRSGRRFDTQRPDPEAIALDDIAHALSNLCRYGGHVPQFYSVAQHSVIVARACRRAAGIEAGRWGLLHDAAEAYLGDVIWPLKHHPLMEGYKALEKTVTSAVVARFQLQWPEPEIVNWADRCTMLAEIRDFFGAPAWGEERVGGSVGDNQIRADAAAVGFIRPMDPMEAYREFRTEAFALGILHD